MTAHAERTHALLSASSAYRWLVCTPSARLEANEPDRSSAYAQEGTRAHELCETILTQTPFNAEEYPTEMLRAAREYADYVNENTTADTLRFVEQRVDFSTYVPEGFGTCDCILIDDDTLTIIDFKYGQGVRVEADENPQLKLYALGALNEYGFAFDIKQLKLCVFQPRLNHISEFELTETALTDWAKGTLSQQAAKAAAGIGDFKAGEHCRFCRFAPKCSELRDVCMKDFNVEAVALTREEIADILSKEKMIKSWLEHVKAYAFDQLRNDPEAVPGFKIVEGLTKRRYTDENSIAAALIAAGYSEDQIYTRSLLGLTDMTKLLGKKNIDALIGAYIERPKGKPTLAPLDDSRPQYSVDDDFINPSKED